MLSNNPETSITAVAVAVAGPAPSTDDSADEEVSSIFSGSGPFANTLSTHPPSTSAGPNTVTPPPQSPVSSSDDDNDEPGESPPASRAPSPPSFFGGLPNAAPWNYFAAQPYVPQRNTTTGPVYEYGRGLSALARPAPVHRSADASFMWSGVPAAATTSPFQPWRPPPVSSSKLGGDENDLTPRTMQGANDVYSLLFMKENLDPPTPRPQSALSAQKSVAAAPAAPAKPIMRPTRLCTDDDKEEVNQTHCFVRRECLEIVSVGDGEEEDSDDDSVRRRRTRRRPSANSRGSGTERLFAGRVGFQCSFCANADPADKDTMSVFWPKSVEAIYRQTCTWQRVHFQTCRHVPQAAADEYRRTKEEDRTRGRVPYWGRSAKRIGLKNVEVNGKRGIKFA